MARVPCMADWNDAADYLVSARLTRVPGSKGTRQLGELGSASRIPIGFLLQLSNCLRTAVCHAHSDGPSAVLCCEQCMLYSEPGFALALSRLPLSGTRPTPQAQQHGSREGQAAAGRAQRPWPSTGRERRALAACLLLCPTFRAHIPNRLRYRLPAAAQVCDASAYLDAVHCDQTCRQRQGNCLEQDDSRRCSC